jgi:protein-serine/threonine kinase
VVRLVREKVAPGYDTTSNIVSDAYGCARMPKSKEIYAMKVIRKSDMLRNSQEGHLRAERDFLVRAEGSRW